MRKEFSMLVLIIVSLIILGGCRKEQEVIYVEVSAEILEINQEEKAFLVRGLALNSLIGDKSYVSTRDSKYIEVTNEGNFDIEFKDFSVGDMITVDVAQVSESYPTQTSTNRVRLIERADANYEKISEFMKDQSIAAFSPYYELLDFQISCYEEKLVDDNIEATFYYKIIEKNFDRDPDTVGYIKEAKDSGDKNYQQLYDEYLQARESNFDLKVVIDEDDNIILYSNVSPKGIKWEETKMTDYIIKD